MKWQNICWSAWAWCMMRFLNLTIFTTILGGSKCLKFKRELEDRALQFSPSSSRRCIYRRNLVGTRRLSYVWARPTVGLYSIDPEVQSNRGNRIRQSGRSGSLYAWFSNCLVPIGTFIFPPDDSEQQQVGFCLPQLATIKRHPWFH